MTDDRKRFLFSIAFALILHLAVLILIGLNSFNYEIPKDYGPLLVEITPPIREIIEEQAIKVPVAETIKEHQDPQPAPAPSVVIQKPAVSKSQTVPSASVPVKPADRAEPRPAVASYSRSEPDEDFIAALKNRSAGTEGVDARALFGDETVPSSTDRPDAFQASGQASSSEVVLSDLPAAREEDYRTNVKTSSESRVPSVLEKDVLSSLDASLSAGADAPSAAKTGPYSTVSATETSAFSGTSPLITFENQDAQRELAKWAHPEIPDEIREEGARRYTVVIDFLVDADGLVSSLMLRKPSGKAEIDAAVQSALRTWVFEQAVSNDSDSRKKIPATLTYVIEIK
ncbi:MAG: TonB family protein [Spirochaetales bacterium]|nr:TonB family protein [Spirochaetales bacterium]